MYHLTNHIKLLHRTLGVTELADNGERGDAYQALCFAVGLDQGEPVAVLYTTSNGDPTLIAWAEPNDDRWDWLNWQLGPNAYWQPWMHDYALSKTNLDLDELREAYHRWLEDLWGSK